MFRINGRAKGGRHMPQHPRQIYGGSDDHRARAAGSSVLLDGAYRPSTTSIPESTKPSCAWGNLPLRAVSSALSKLTIWETLATESFGSPVKRGERHIAWSFGPLEVARKWHTHDRRNSAPV